MVQTGLKLFKFEQATWHKIGREDLYKTDNVTLTIQLVQRDDTIMLLLKLSKTNVMLLN